MRCEICSNETDTVYVLPIPQSNGKLDTHTCQKCAIEKGYYCTKHDAIHLGFIDLTHACRACIEEIVFQLEGDTRYYRKLKENLSDEAFFRLSRLLQSAQEITGNSFEQCIIRYLATASLRFQMTTREVLSLIIEYDDIYLIAPNI